MLDKWTYGELKMPFFIVRKCDQSGVCSMLYMWYVCCYVSVSKGNTVWGLTVWSPWRRAGKDLRRSKSQWETEGVVYLFIIDTSMQTLLLCLTWDLIVCYWLNLILILYSHSLDEVNIIPSLVSFTFWHYDVLHRCCNNQSGSELSRKEAQAGYKGERLSEQYQSLLSSDRHSVQSNLQAQGWTRWAIVSFFYSNSSKDKCWRLTTFIVVICNWIFCVVCISLNFSLYFLFWVWLWSSELAS